MNKTDKKIEKEVRTIEITTEGISVEAEKKTLMEIFRVNKGIFKKDKYIKYVNFNEAVLWKTKELSLPLHIIKRIRNNDVSTIEFIDKNKDTKYVFSTEDVLDKYKFKKEGQEPQCYFSIKLASEIPNIDVKNLWSTKNTH